MNTLIVSQTIFYLASSIAIIVIGVLIVIVIYYLICILRNTRDISDDISQTYNKTRKSIKKIVDLFGKKKK